jgi:hypothetical protein
VRRVRAGDAIDDLRDRRLGAAQIQPRRLVESGAPGRRHENDQAKVRREATTLQERRVLPLYQLDPPVQFRDIAPGQLMDLRIELEGEALGLRHVPQNPIERVA